MLKPFPFPPEFDSSVADGPSAGFTGGWLEDGGPESGGGGDGSVNGDVGASKGAVTLPNGFPSFLHSKISKLETQPYGTIALHTTFSSFCFKDFTETRKLKYQTDRLEENINP